MAKTLILDLDDTLVETSSHYVEAKLNAACTVNQLLGVPARVAYGLIDAYDNLLMCVEPARRVRLGRAVAQAGLSMERVYGRWLPVAPRALGELAVTHITEARYEPYPGVQSVLERLRAEGWQLVVWTKGEEEFQQEKVARSGLRHLVDRVVVEMYKTSERLRRLLEDELRLDPGVHAIVVVGDSAVDEIGAGNELGIPTIQIASRGVAAQDEAVGTLCVSTVTQLPDALATLLTDSFAGGGDGETGHRASTTPPGT
jgi:putative hydrolase of the HAD superfamily